MSFFNFSSNIVYSSSKLPLTLMTLEDWSFITVEGQDSKKYLQDQLTIDILQLKKKHYTLCAHCNFNGKVWSTMYLFHYKKYYAYIERASVADKQIKELQKYSIFSSVTIKKKNNICLLGLSGLNARVILSYYFKKIPNIIYPISIENGTIILWFNNPIERFLLVLSFDNAILLKNKIEKYALLNNSKQWLLLDIESGFPIIDHISSDKFFPQAINLDKLKAINFYKGCYYGQEIISRIYFKNLNKRYLCYLIGKGNISPKIGSLIEVKIEKKWYRIGILIAFVCVNINEIWIQVVLDRFICQNSLFRIDSFKNIFFIKN
ncbi:tRNA-modifying protein YgfZ [Buchnera aphidicola]|uniref:tRNA-modifying protein YgfZ n=1 Tax=Buchnera aphidicola TaxID=9 RepID=UPI003BEEC47F